MTIGVAKLKLHALLVALAVTAMVSPADAGKISGQVSLPNADRLGTPPVKSTGFIDRIKNPLRPPKSYDPLPEFVIVLVGGPADPGFKPSKRPVRFDIIGESFERPVLPVLVGSKIEVRNRGRGTPRLRAPGKTGFFLDESGPINPNGERTSVPIDTAHTPVEIRDIDSVHLIAHVVAFDSPYFTTVDPNGSFSFDDVPNGTWKVRVWYRTGFLDMPETTISVATRGVAKTKITIPPAMKIEASK